MRVNLQPLTFMKQTFLKMVERSVHVRHVPLADELADDEVLAQEHALLRASAACNDNLRTVLDELVDVLVEE